MLPKRAGILLAAACITTGVICNLDCRKKSNESTPATSAATAQAGQFVRLSGRIDKVMGCDCLITLYLPADQQGRFNPLLADAASRLNKLEDMMSVYRPQSEISILNAAPAGREIELSAPVMDLMRRSRKFFDQTDGTFDITCLPIIKIWRQAGKSDQAPDREKLAEAVALAGWKKVRLTERGAVKLDDRAGVDLGGIAKGYAVDVLAEFLVKAGVPAGMVDLGGSSIRCFGVRPDGRKWRIAVRNPFVPDGDFLGVLEMRSGSMSVSGNYERFVMIAGKRYSHIVDPRTGWPADQTPSAAILAPDAITAEAWSKPLSVLGEEGFKLIPAGSGIEALIVVGTPDEYEILFTNDFDRFVPTATRPATQPISRPAR